MIQFYKPNPKVTGTACSFWLTKDDSLMVSVIKQDAWDSNKKRGTFSKNRGVASKEVKFKLNEVEVAAIIDCINSIANHPMAYDSARVAKSVRPFSAYHQSENQVVQINFSEYILKEEVKGFSFSVHKSLKDDSTTKGSFVLGFTFAEAELLKRFLLTYLDMWFDGKISSALSNSFKEKEKPKRVEENKESSPVRSEESEDDWW